MEASSPAFAPRVQGQSRLFLIRILMLLGGAIVGRWGGKVLSLLLLSTSMLIITHDAAAVVRATLVTAAWTGMPPALLRGRRGHHDARVTSLAVQFTYVQTLNVRAFSSLPA